MKKQIIYSLIAIIFFYSCTQSSSGNNVNPTSPTSTFNIHFNGKTYSVNTASAPTSVVSAITTYGPGDYYGNWDNNIYAGYGVGIVATSAQILCIFKGGKLDASTAIGTYRSGGCTYNSPLTTIYLSYGAAVLELTDHEDGNKKYSSDYSGVDTTSTITVSVANANECKGTFNVVLSCNGNHYPATGDFDYKH